MDTDQDISFPPRMEPSDLASRLGHPNAPWLLDVRREPVYARSPYQLPGARRCAPEELAVFGTRHPPREVLVYCVHGHQVSETAVRELRAAGWKATQLAGGIDGGEDGVDDPANILRWRANALPRMLKRADLGVTGAQPSRWITRERPKIDRIACPWLIRRWIDPLAESWFVPAAQVFAQAERLGAVPFDIPGAPISHEGPLCSFDALLSAFGLDHPALTKLATIVRGADTDALQLAPQSAGLLAVSLGLSALHRDDHAMLESAMPLYDALLAWCRQDAPERYQWHAGAGLGDATAAKTGGVS